MTREQKMLAVVEAARHWASAAAPYRKDYSGDAQAIIDAVAALDALTAEPQEDKP